jgi:hypothetical protein
LSIEVVPLVCFSPNTSRHSIQPSANTDSKSKSSNKGQIDSHLCLAGIGLNIGSLSKALLLFSTVTLKITFS